MYLRASLRRLLKKILEQRLLPQATLSRVFEPCSCDSGQPLESRYFAVENWRFALKDFLRSRSIAEGIALTKLLSKFGILLNVGISGTSRERECVLAAKRHESQRLSSLQRRRWRECAALESLSNVHSGVLLYK